MASTIPTTVGGGNGRLPPEYWRPAKVLGEQLHTLVLPELRGFKGQELSNPFLWMARVDVGAQNKPHDADIGARNIDVGAQNVDHDP